MACNNESTCKKAFFKILNHENYTFKVSLIQTTKNSQWRTLEIISQDIQNSFRKHSKDFQKVKQNCRLLFSPLESHAWPVIRLSFFPSSFFASLFSLCWLFALPSKGRKLPNHRLSHANIIHRLVLKVNGIYMFSIHSRTNNIITISQWCHFTTTTRILQFVVFLCK